MLKDHIFLYGNTKYKRRELAYYIKKNYRNNASIIAFDSPLEEYIKECFGLDQHHPSYAKLCKDTKNKLLKHFGSNLLIDTLFKKVRAQTPVTKPEEFDGYIIYDGYTHAHIQHEYLKIWLTGGIPEIDLEQQCDILLTTDRPFEEQNFNFFYQDFHKLDNTYFGELGKKSVFVYETNLAGVNVTNSSITANKYYGVTRTYFNHIFKSNTGVLCYAIPTRDLSNNILPAPIIQYNLIEFFNLARNTDNLTFYLSDFEEDVSSIALAYFNSVPYNVKISYRMQKNINN